MEWIVPEAILLGRLNVHAVYTALVAFLACVDFA